VFFSGMPSEAAGPVADSVTPMLISAWAAKAIPSASAGSSLTNFIGLLRWNGAGNLPVPRLVRDFTANAAILASPHGPVNAAAAGKPT